MEKSCDRKLFVLYTDKKENEIFLIYKENQLGWVTKSYKKKVS